MSNYENYSTGFTARAHRTARGRAAHRRGLAAEGLAEAYLALRGYRVLARRYKVREGEADLIAARGDVLALVEVKARATAAEAARAVTSRAWGRVAAAGLAYLAAADPPPHPDAAVRLDLIALSEPRAIAHIPRAWEG